MELETIQIGDRIRITQGRYQGKLGTVLAIDEQYDPPYAVKLDDGMVLYYRYDEHSKYFEKVA